MSKGGSRHTRRNQVIAGLDEIVVLAHAARHRLGGLVDYPEFCETEAQRFCTEAEQLVGETMRNIRHLRAA